MKTEDFNIKSNDATSSSSAKPDKQTVLDVLLRLGN